MEKFDKDIAKIIGVRLENYGAIISDAFQHEVAHINNAETIDDVMSAKRNLMVQIAKNIPIRDDTCYFCVHYRGRGSLGCDICSYSETHDGRCGDRDSVWRKIIDAKWVLIDLIQKKYWTGGEMDAEYQGHKTNTS